MKKLLAIVLCCLILSGCTTQQPAPTDDPGVTIPQTEAETTAPATEPETTTPDISLTVYIPNENADGFETMPVVTASADAEAILALLIEHSILNEDIVLNSMAMEGRQLNLDFNQAFLDQLRSYGTAGERMMMGCVVNTFLSVYDADTVYITVNGQIFESGHAIYDFPMGYFQ